MTNVEQIFSNLPTPTPSNELDDRMDRLFMELRPVSEIGNSTLAPHQSNIASRRKLMLRGLGFTGALAASGLLILGFNSGLGGSSPAYAEVVQSVKGLSTVKYLQVGIGTRQKLRADDVPSPSTIVKDAIEKRAKVVRDLLDSDSIEVAKRQELNAELRVLHEFIKQDSPPLVSLAWCRVNAPDQLRSEVVFPYEGVSIHNRDDAIFLDRSNRRAIRRTTTILDQDGKRLDVGLYDFVSLLQIPELAVKELPVRAIDGVSYVGFERKTDKKGSTQTWWVAKGTSLPARVEIKSCFKKNVVSSEMVFREITYNIDLKAELFDTTPPAGYELSDESNTFMFDTESAAQN